jgi:flagellar protein FlgJ
LGRENANSTFEGLASGDATLDALIGASSNEWLSDGQRGVVNALIQQKMRASDPLHQLQLEQSQLGLEKSRLELEQLRNPQAQMTAEQQNLAWRAQQAGLEPGTPEYQEFILGGGDGPMVSVNVGEGDKFFEELDKKNAQMFSDLSNAGAGAQRKIMQIDHLSELLANAPTGAGAGFKQILGNFGIETEGLSEIQAAQALINEMVPQQRPAGSGPMSDADLELFKQSLPRIINQPGGNDLILQTMRGIAEYELQQGRIADMVANREIPPSDGRQRLRELANPLDGFGERTKGFANQASDLPEGVREIDIQHTMKVHNLSREEVLERINAN